MSVIYISASPIRKRLIRIFALTGISVVSERIANEFTDIRLIAMVEDLLVDPPTIPRNIKPPDINSPNQSRLYKMEAQFFGFC